jgi:hypothetical protein
LVFNELRRGLDRVTIQTLDRIFGAVDQTDDAVATIG